MMSYVQENQQLFALGLLLFLTLAVLLFLQFLALCYGQQLATQIIRGWVMAKRYLSQNQVMILFQSSHPKLFATLARRFDLRHFGGLSLTILTAMMVYILALFIGLVEDVAMLKPIVETDYFISGQMSLLRNSPIIGFFIHITSFASTPMTVLVMLLTIAICLVLRQPFALLGLFIATVGSAAFTFLSKMLFQRERPADILLFEHTHSFPSGHATITLALYGFITYLLMRFSQNYVHKIRIFVMATFFMVLIGLSRIVLNEHYLSDVLGGYLVGGLWLTFAISVTEWLSAKGKIDWQVEWSANHIYLVWLSGVAIFISTILYATFFQFPLLS
ncbi:phosphatase PAP2 family protein [Psychrobacter ciconiae]|uniref:phosphatase PAP2 family protein n=1 Tax=Psychrobacter ciconiae TaxID=1553449 RepID=UPI001918481F|nr:phosphatase PAP2 family protein [Psychrobacter ciconiae]